MPWPVILIVLTLALASAGLISLQGMEPWYAFLVVGMAAAGLVILLSVLLILGGRENRREYWRIFTAIFLDDLDQMLKYFGIRKKG